MDSFTFDNVKAEKAKALRRYNRFRSIGRFFRAAEVCVAVIFILWTFTRLPFAVQISREFLRRIAGVISTPLFVFLFGNCIVVALLAKSSVEENRGSTASDAETEIYEALVRSKPSDEEGEELAEEIVYDDKEVVVVADSSNNNIPHGLEIDSDTCPVSDEPKEYGRSKSDKYSPDYVVATEKSHTVEEFLELSFGYVGFNWKDHVEIDKRYFRPTEVDNLKGDASKAKEVLKWKPKVGFE
ncbi:hypothetical protein HID58_032376 [Brassica napus]|uniref:NAD(P)-binding domain-containing protein n=1 Tax=Brassica napus TaxID=3708 RepID=A0ABQ8BXS7_BRANA|nr:hypothetical protein HID58_032376 [Brassica napus]